MRVCTLIFAAVLCGSLTSLADDAKKGDWTQLFNGKDLAGWDTWLGRPYKEKEVVGLNKDPRQVYAVVDMDGQPAIRISGQTFGALTTKEEFENYHLKLEFKWGEKKWPPRENAVRDSGLLYHCTGPHGAHGSFWMQSLECQIQEHDCGDFWPVANVSVDVEGEMTPMKTVVYKKGGTKMTGLKRRIVRDADHEKPLGQWNMIELLTVGSTSVHVVNGKANMVLTNARRKVGDKDE